MLKNNQPQETKAPESKDSKENQRLVADLNKLRSRAEKLMTPDGRQDIALMSTDGIAKLIYELDTHKIELEMQNLELHRAQDELIEVHTQYTELYDLAPIGYFTIDENGLILQANQTISSMLNVVDNQLKMQLLHNFIYPQDQDIYYFYRRNVLATTETLSCELRLRTNSRGFFWVRMDSTRVENKNGNISIRSVLSDITQSKLAEQEVLRVNNELESRVEERTRQLQQEIEERKLIEADLRKVSRAVDFSSSAIFITDANHKIEIVNPKFTEITGFTKAEAIGKEPRELLLGKTSAGAYTQMQDTIASGEEWKGELYNRKKDGSYYRARISISAVKDSDGLITNYIGIQDDLSHELELKAQLNVQSCHDPLTGLINRREFERRAERLISSVKKASAEHASCFIAIGQVEAISRTCGREAADEFLHELGEALQGGVRHSDILACLGDEEFVVLMENCSLNQAQQVATSLEWIMRDFRFAWKDETFRVAASFGLVVINESISNLDELLKCANIACYMANELGHNRIHLYQEADSRLPKRRSKLDWKADINRALDENRFCLFAQPVVPLGGSKNIQYELLLRMEDDNDKILLPGSFIPAAERYNLIGQLDAWVIKNAFQLFANHPQFINQVDLVSINLSEQSLTSDKLLPFILAQFEEYDIEPGSICFEIRETVAILNLPAVTSFISALKNIGCQFALDDFGSGLSTFAYLKNLPVDYLKIDGIYVKDIVNNGADYAMLKSINDIGQVLGIATIAKFVENDEIKQLLARVGVNHAQGNAIGEPQSLKELLRRSSTVSIHRG